MSKFKLYDSAKVCLPGSFAHGQNCTIVSLNVTVMHGTDYYTGHLVDIPNQWCSLGFCVFKDNELIPTAKGDKLEAAGWEWMDKKFPSLRERSLT